ncbi:MAG TPA: DUF364 domain-containing protein [Rhodopila sp.]|uniref:DUF364 domain-containing protein n=1 Tax=Rhodopila sp. TaxID=2480087 RepID=UPI002CC3EE16|nr:DUF364 domain-containing protein [Rhodopila sp.]HVY13771.1 DUF364 domain-containing protein [Rhodopila sp.]
MTGETILSETILSETIRGIRHAMGAALDRVTVERAVVGLFFTGVKLDTGVAGACATPLRSIPEAVCCPSSAMAMPFPGRLRGRPARELLTEVAAASGIRRALGIATANALAAMCWERRTTPDVALQVGVDAYDAARIQPGERVVVVGAFVPFLKALKQARQPWTVLEMDPATLKGEELAHFRHASEAPAVVPDADVVLITGTTLLNDTVDPLLALCRPQARVVVVGPTVGLFPDAFLRRGVDVMGGIRVTDPDTFLDVLAEGGSGYHFFGKSAEKVVLVRQPAHEMPRAAE